MRQVWALVTTLAWGLWFGGMVALFLFVSYLFVSDRATAMVAAPKMFFAFERYQLAVATVAIIAAAAWRLSTRRVVLTAIFVLFALSAAGTVVGATFIRGPMEQLRVEGRSSGPEFTRLHKASERVYIGQAVLLLIAGIILPSAHQAVVRPDPLPDKEPGADAPSAPQA